jgi:hypothetical protein
MQTDEHRSHTRTGESGRSGRRGETKTRSEALETAHLIETKSIACVRLRK